MSNLLSFEPHVDNTISFFFDQLDKRFASTGETCDLGAWLQMFAFDVMGELTFSKRLGFLERGGDVDGIMGSIWRYFWKTSPVSDVCVCRNCTVVCVEMGVDGVVVDYTDTVGGSAVGEESRLPALEVRGRESYRGIWACAHCRAERGVAGWVEGERGIQLSRFSFPVS